MIILADVDGVFADFVSALCSELGHRGFSRTPDSVLHWDLSACLSAEELRAALEIMSTPGFCHGITWYEGAREFAAALAGMGEVHAVTAPFRSGATWISERMGWLSGVLHAERVHFVHGKYKHMVRGDVLIEDHPGNAAAWLDSHPRGLAILIDRPWNAPGAREYWPHTRMLRAHSFGEALELVRKALP